MHTAERWQMNPKIIDKPHAHKLPYLTCQWPILPGPTAVLPAEASSTSGLFTSRDRHFPLPRARRHHFSRRIQYGVPTLPSSVLRGEEAVETFHHHLPKYSPSLPCPVLPHLWTFGTDGDSPTLLRTAAAQYRAVITFKTISDRFRSPCCNNS